MAHDSLIGSTISKISKKMPLVLAQYPYQAF
jgi:hypothetical protein